jgi:RNA polymerase-binding transcription factor DksA
MKTNELDGMRLSLLDEKERLVSALEYLRAENPGAEAEQVPELSTLEGHLAEAGALTLDREIDYTLEEATQAHLEAVDLALGKIEQGRFGLCESCSQPIASERLEALPWATLCIDCKRREERG